MTKRTMTLLAAGVLAAAMLAGCSSGDQGEEDASDSSTATSTQAHDHGEMAHSPDGGPVPDGMTVAADPRFPVGSRVTLTADHMESMKGAEATTTHSTDETVYVLDGESGVMTMTNHTWLVEIEMQRAS